MNANKWLHILTKNTQMNKMDTSNNTTNWLYRSHYANKTSFLCIFDNCLFDAYIHQWYTHCPASKLVFHANLTLFLLVLYLVKCWYHLYHHHLFAYQTLDFFFESPSSNLYQKKRKKMPYVFQFNHQWPQSLEAKYRDCLDKSCWILPKKGVIGFWRTRGWQWNSELRLNKILEYHLSCY